MVAIAQLVLVRPHRVFSMPASPQEIKDAIDGFIALVEDDAIPAEDRLQRLRRALDHLALLQHDVTYTFDEGEYPDAPDIDFNALRQLVSKHFPELGYYNMPSSITQHISAADMDVADAIHDIADITRELYEVRWRWEHTSVDDAIWYFKDMYLHHWEAHLRELQLCLQRLLSGHEETDAA
jgi:hypothetical protein